MGADLELFKISLFTFLSAEQREDLLKMVELNIKKKRELELQRVVTMVVMGAYLHQVSSPENFDEGEFLALLQQSSYLSTVEECVELRQKSINNYRDLLQYHNKELPEAGVVAEVKKNILSYMEEVKGSPEIGVDWNSVVEKVKEILKN